VLLQHHRQAGAEAARSFHRPTATARQLRLGEVEQLPVADRVGAGGDLSQHAAEVADGGCGEGVAVGVDADDAVDQLCQHGHAVVLLVRGRPWSASAWEESPRGRTVTGHNPQQGWTGC
jgi:hypothetical protein